MARDRRIIAILAADVVGYSRLMGMDEESTLDGLKLRRAIFGQVVVECGGREFGSVGDSLMAQFPSAVNAIRSAQLIQQRISEENDKVPADQRMQLRIGVHLGDVIEEQDAFFGDAVNIAARLQALAKPGGVFISSAVFDQVRNKHPARYVDVGARQVKNITEPVRVFEVLAAEPAGFFERLSDTVARLTAYRTYPWLAPAVAAAAIVAAAVTFSVASRQGESLESRRARIEGSGAPQERTVAVLPFTNLSGEQPYEYFSDGLTEELLNRLGEVPGITVAARTSSFHFKGSTQAAPTIGKMLGVRHLVEGSVRKSGNRLRITAQLVDAMNGYRLWSQSYDRQVADLLDIQDEIALAVVAHVEPTLLSAARDRLVPRGTRNEEALDYYLQAMKLREDITVENADKGISYYERAIALDPGFALAYLSLASALSQKRQVAELSPQDPLVARIPVLIDRALEIDPTLGKGHALLGAHLMLTLDFEGAEDAMKRAEALAPSDSDVLFHLSQYYAFVGWPPEKGIDYARRASRLDPYSLFAATNVGIAFWHAHQYESALKEVDRVIEVDPKFWAAHWNRAAILRDLGRQEEAMAAALRAMALNDYADTRVDVAIGYANLGQPEKAREILRWLEDPARGKYVHPTWRAWILVALKDYDGALSALEQAYEERDWALPDVAHVKHMLPLHGMPRFDQLVKKLGQERRMAYAERAYGVSVARRTD